MTPSDIHERRLTPKDPKSGREQEFIFILQRIADRLKSYIWQKDIQHQERIFPICYESAREMVAKAGGVVGIHLVCGSFQSQCYRYIQNGLDNLCTVHVFAF